MNPIKIYCKEGVWFKFISYEFLIAARTVYRVLQRYKVIPTVTSACDSKHMPNSWHYKGLAWDFRIWGVDDPKTVQNEVKEAADEIRRQLNEVDFRYDVVYGDEKHLDHIHIEFDETKKKEDGTI